MARICIVSRKEVPTGHGNPIKQDAIIRTIRNIKRKMGILQNNELVVSDECLEQYKKKRSKFEKMAVIHTTVAAIVILILVFAPLLLGAPFNIMTIFFAFILGIMIAALALLSYVPGLDTGKEAKPRTPAQVAKKLAPKKAAYKSGKAKTKPPRKRKKK